MEGEGERGGGSWRERQRERGEGLEERRLPHPLPHMKPFSLVLLSRCSLTIGASF